jgi:hypothetical protein
MDFGAAIFFTEYSMDPAKLGQALEQCIFGSLSDEVLPVLDRCVALMR